MNISLNTYSQPAQYNRLKNNNNINRQNSTPAFTGAADKVAESVVKKSGFMGKFFKNCEQKYDAVGEWLAQKVIPKVFDNNMTDKFTNKVKESDRLFSHFLAVGSAITSGMYMYKTLNNDKLDQDRKNTLAVNQFLTFLLSTGGAYMLDSSLSSWWQNMTVRYAAGQCKDKNMNLLAEFKEEVKKAKAENIEIKKANKALKDAAKAEGRKIAKSELQDLKSVKADKFLSKRIGNYMGTPEAAEQLTRRIKGMGYLKTMLVFALVYRYIVPVAVTKPANMLCDKYLAHKKEKQTEKVPA